MKRCKSCGFDYELSEFRKHAGHPDGHEAQCRGCRRVAEKVYTAKLRAEAINAYGGPACAKCGSIEYASLHIDHVEGGGNEQRRGLYAGWNSGGRRFWAWLKRHGWPEGFRVLCRKCNCYFTPSPKANLETTDEKS